MAKVLKLFTVKNSANLQPDKNTCWSTSIIRGTVYSMEWSPGMEWNIGVESNFGAKK